MQNIYAALMNWLIVILSLYLLYPGGNKITLGDNGSNYESIFNHKCSHSYREYKKSIKNL